MNFEVSGGKVYKEASCQGLGSNWERIESDDRPPLVALVAPAARAATGKESKVKTLISEPRAPALAPKKRSNWERIESLRRSRGGSRCRRSSAATGKELKGVEVGVAQRLEDVFEAATGKELKASRTGGTGIPRSTSSNWERIERRNSAPAGCGATTSLQQLGKN